MLAFGLPNTIVVHTIGNVNHFVAGKQPELLVASYKERSLNSLGTKPEN